MALQLRSLAETDVRQAIPPDQLLPALRTPPFVLVPGTFNTRDLGLLDGVSSVEITKTQPLPSPQPSPASSRSCPIRPGFIYRSGGLDQLRDHPEGQARLRDELGVRRIFDLRSRAEREAAPDPEISGVQGVWTVPVRGGDVSTVVKGGFLRDGVGDETRPEREGDDGDVGGDGGGQVAERSGDEDNAHVDLASFVEGRGEKGHVAMYMDVLAAYAGAFREVLLSIRDRPGEGILFHCTAGRDRTGVLAGLLESLAGYHTDLVRADFLLTRIGYEPARERLLRFALKGAGVASSSAKADDGQQSTVDVDLSTLYEVPGFYNLASLRAECWDAFVAAVRSKWGGFEGYVVREMGFSEGDVLRIKRNLVHAPE